MVLLALQSLTYSSDLSFVSHLLLLYLVLHKNYCFFNIVHFVFWSINFIGIFSSVSLTFWYVWAVISKLATLFSREMFAGFRMSEGSFFINSFAFFGTNLVFMSVSTVKSVLTVPALVVLTQSYTWHFSNLLWICNFTE